MKKYIIFTLFLLSTYSAAPMDDRLALRKWAQIRAAVAAQKEWRRHHDSPGDGASAAVVIEESEGVDPAPQDAVRKILTGYNAEQSFSSLIEQVEAQAGDVSLSDIFTRFFPTKKWHDLSRFDASNLTPEQAMGKRVATELGKDGFEFFIEATSVAFVLRVLKEARDDLDCDSD